MTALHLCATYGLEDVCYYLLTQTYDSLLGLEDVSQDEKVKRINEFRNLLVSAVDEDGRNPVHLACLYGHGDVLRALLGVDTSESEEPMIGCSKALCSEDRAGLTPLHLACLNGHYRCVEIIVQKLLEACDMTPLMAADRDGRLPLHALCQSSRITSMKKENRKRDRMR